MLTRILDEAECRAAQGCKFEYSSNSTPLIQAISTNKGSANDEITLSGLRLDSVDNLNENKIVVTVGGIDASVVSSESNKIVFKVPAKVTAGL